MTWAYRYTCAATAAARRIDRRLRHGAQLRPERDRARLARFAAHPALDALQRKASRPDLRHMREGDAAIAAVQRMRRARSGAVAAQAACSTRELWRWIAVGVGLQQAGGAGAHAITAARAALQEGLRLSLIHI